MSGKRLALDIAVGVLVGSVVGLVTEVPWQWYLATVLLGVVLMPFVARFARSYAGVDAKERS